jgi:hypothetical protein
MTTFRAVVAPSQVDRIALPEPERLTRTEALGLASWAVTLGVPADDDPSTPARIRDMFGFRAAQHLQQLNPHLAERIGPHVALAAKHSLIVELDDDGEGQYFHVVRRRDREPDLCIRHASAMMLLEAMNVVSPRPNETCLIAVVSRALAKSQAACIDICMGHYHDKLTHIVAYGQANAATMISWETPSV